MRMQRVAIVLTVINTMLLLGMLLEPGPGLAQAVPSVVRARAIELVDDRGQVRAQLNVEAGGEAVFRMRDANGTIRVKLGASEGGSGFLLLDEATEPGVQVLAGRNGTSLTLKRGDRQQALRP